MGLGKRIQSFFMSVIRGSWQKSAVVHLAKTAPFFQLFSSFASQAVKKQFRQFICNW